jgi:hypothetical protein
MQVSLDLLVVLDDLVELIELSFLVLVEFLHNELLRVHAVIHLLLEFLECCCHPVLIVFSWRCLLLLQLLTDIAPDLSHLEVRVHLDDL